MKIDRGLMVHKRHTYGFVL